MGTVSPDHKSYPLLRYMGSKYKLLDWIRKELGKLDFDTALDGFSGSGAVSYLLKTMGKQVYSNDFLHMSYTLSHGVIENGKQNISEEEGEALFADAPGAPDFIRTTFKDIFYSAEELHFLDQAYFNIEKLEDPYKKSLAKAALIRSCIKKQPRGVFTISGDMSKYHDGRRDLRLSLPEHFREQLEIYSGVVFDNGRDNKAFQGDIYEFDTARYKPDLVYLDPPYVPRSDDNCYIKRYHFIEGLSKYWEGEEIRYDTKVRKIKKKYTPFSYRRTAGEAFDTMFSKFSDSIIVLSYSSNGYPGLGELKEILGRYKDKVTVKKKSHKYHFGNHKTVSRSKVEEYLIIGQ